MGEIVHMRDYEPRRRAAITTNPPTETKIVILPVVRIETDGWLTQQRRRETEEA